MSARAASSAWDNPRARRRPAKSVVRSWGDYDPGPDLDQLTTPTLAIFGGNDPLVPVQASIARLRDTAGRTARLQQITVFPGAGHRLQAGISPAPGYLACLSTWSREPPPGPGPSDSAARNSW